MDGTGMYFDELPARIDAWLAEHPAWDRLLWPAYRSDTPDESERFRVRHKESGARILADSLPEMIDALAGACLTGECAGNHPPEASRLPGMDTSSEDTPTAADVLYVWLARDDTEGEGVMVAPLLSAGEPLPSGQLFFSMVFDDLDRAKSYTPFVRSEAEQRNTIAKLVAFHRGDVLAEVAARM